MTTYKKVCGCGRKFTCEGECGDLGKAENERTCFCGKCLNETLEKMPDFCDKEPRHLCKTRMEMSEEFIFR